MGCTDICPGTVKPLQNSLEVKEAGTVLLRLQQQPGHTGGTDPGNRNVTVSPASLLARLQG